MTQVCAWNGSLLRLFHALQMHTIINMIWKLQHLFSTFVEFNERKDRAKFNMFKVYFVHLLLKLSILVM